MLLVASASFTGAAQSPVKITWVVASGLIERAPRVKLLMLRSTWGIGLAATKPNLPDLDRWPATTPATYWASSI